jgi:tetratricopeptide (TPR) repeat protein
MRLHLSKGMVSLFLILITLAAYWHVSNHDFVNYDDTKYVTKNSTVQAGITWEGIVWAFTTTHTGNWHPLAWLSHMLDCELYGLNPSGHHLTSVLLHIVNSLLLFFVLRLMTGALWQCAFVAALFAVHPLHVESVAWVSERKDLLSTFFWILTLWAYTSYVNSPGSLRYSLTIVLFALGLMAKPMVVTLPFVLLLMDFWPLCRFDISCFDHSVYVNIGGTPRSSNSKLRISYLVSEKLPLFGLAAASSVTTFFVQQSGSNILALSSLPFGTRIANAVVAYASYVGKTIWPLNLAVFYPHPEMVRLLQLVLCLFLLLGGSFLMIRCWRARPHFTVGWLWYLGTLVPVIGLVQVGDQSMADRYTYIPLIGLFIIFAWGLFGLGVRHRRGKVLASIVAGVLVVILGICTSLQVRHWQDSFTLFGRTLAVTRDNYLAHFAMGSAFASEGKFEPAITHYSLALQIKPDYATAHFNMGYVLYRQGKIRKAIDHYSKAIEIAPNLARAHYNLGVAFYKLRMLNEAISHYSQALEIMPDNAAAHHNIGVALAAQGRFEEARAHYLEALRIKPDFQLTQRKLAHISRLLDETSHRQ